MNFEWKLPTKFEFGAGRFATAHKLLRGLGKRALLVTSNSFGKGGSNAAVLDELLAQLKRIGTEVWVFDEVEPNPSTTTVDRGAVLAREFRPRYVLALGGGSVMDTAKCLALLAVNEGEIYEYTYRGPGKPMKPFNHALPVVCIPTVAATGSEASLYAVVRNTRERRKTTVFGEALIPTLAIIDPELTYTVGARQTIDGAFDMITHVMESYLSTAVPAPIQDRLTEAFVETVVTHLPRALAKPNDELARSQLSWCGALALSGILRGRRGGWPIHALEHGLSAQTGSAHGRGLALLLPRMMAFDSSTIPEKINAFNLRIFDKPDMESGLVAYMKNLGAWTTLGDLLAPGADAQEIVTAAVGHALEVEGIWKTGQEPYLDNIRPLRAQDARDLLLA
ncbi:MAG: iron-containing alcohol dehydrogenase [Deltaproteobacteria bacterium]|nr:iron-containing alcohol dehydrogenase [Deltaproteobacteria bacterium]